ncbi:hypothetical protein AB4097_11915 [Microvirga sp. 2MCAF35]|uniref:hypothetical protein n=1 Tax=Microvirga sp. 2MCAF35 TaxID=3232987 RepID=UPI003F9D245E
MKFFPKPASLSRIALLCAVLGASAATQAQAFFRMDDRPPPNGANGTSLNGLTLNGLTLNGLTLNGLTLNGLTVNGLTVNGRDVGGRIVQDLSPHAVTLPNGERVELR